MTMITRWAPMLGAICVCCVANTANTAHADGNNQRLKLLQLQTLNRIAPQAAPTRNNTSNDNNGRQDRGADGRVSQPQPDNRSTSVYVPARKP